MGWMRLVLVMLPFLLFFTQACGGAAIPPKELTDARNAYTKAQTGPAAELTPAQLHEAKVALDRAEVAFKDSPTDQETVDLAYVAERKAQYAEALAGTMKAGQQKASAIKERDARQEGELTRAQSELSKTKEQLESERRARLETERKLVDTMQTLQKVAATKDESRGLVITLEGGLFFQTNKAALLAGAMIKLDQIAEALRGQERAMVVEGHTDSQGKAAANQELSEKRAATVRDYLVSKGIPSDRIRAVGLGSARPVAENTSPEGRAANRRVEIVVEPPKK